MYGLICFGILFAAAGQPPPPGQAVGAGLELLIEWADPRPYLIVGERLDNVKVKLTFENNSKEPLTYLPFQTAWQVGLFEVVVTQEGTRVEQWGRFPIQSNPPSIRPVLAPGKSLSSEIELGFFGYKRLTAPGRVTIRAEYRPENLGSEPIPSDPLVVSAIDIPDKAVRHAETVPLAGYLANRFPGEKPKVIVQQVDLGEESWLLCRQFAGPKYGGVNVLTERLARVKSGTKFTVSGSFGGEETLRVTYPSAPGKLTILEIHPTRGTVERRQVIDE